MLYSMVLNRQNKYIICETFNSFAITVHELQSVTDRLMYKGSCFLNIMSPALYYGLMYSCHVGNWKHVLLENNK